MASIFSSLKKHPLRVVAAAGTLLSGVVLVSLIQDARRRLQALDAPLGSCELNDNTQRRELRVQIAIDEFVKEPRPGAAVSRVRSMFLSADANGDGLVDREELKTHATKLVQQFGMLHRRLVKKLIPSDLDQYVEQVLNEFDDNNDGKLDCAEFERYSHALLAKIFRSK